MHFLKDAEVLHGLAIELRGEDVAHRLLLVHKRLSDIAKRDKPSISVNDIQNRRTLGSCHHST